MAITIPMIIDRLHNKVLKNESVFKDRATDIQDVELLDSPIEMYKDNTMYVLQYPMQIIDLKDALPMNLLYLQSVSGFYIGKSLENQPILVLEGESDPKKLVAEIRAILLYYREIFDNLLSMVCNEAGLQNLTNVISSYFMNPVAIFTSGCKLLAQSQNFTLKTKEWRITEEKGYLEMNGDLSSSYKDVLKLIDQNKSPFIYKVKGMKTNAGSKTLFHLNNPVGIFQVIEDNQIITQGTLDLMEALSVYLAIEVSKNDLLHFNNRILNGQLIIDLLEKKVDNLQTLQNRSKNLGWLFAKCIFILAIKPISHFLVDGELSDIRNQVNILLPFSNCLVYDNGIVVLINRNDDIPFTHEIETQLLALLKQYDLCCGLSQCSTNMLEAARLYKQGLQAIKFGLLANPGCFIYNYSCFTLSDFFDSCLQNENINDYYHPAISILNDYDAKHQSMLENTLYNYIHNHNNQMGTANQLHIHRSTLLYRLHKIEELTGINLDNPEILFHLQLSFKLLEYEKYFTTLPEENIQ
jgi:PucR family transcriptional regulator, proline-responsive transcriptional activator